MHDLLPLIENPQISHNLVTSEQNFMKLKINFKQTRATLVGDINSPNLLVFTIVHSGHLLTKQLSPIMVAYYFVCLLETIRCNTATVYVLYRMLSASNTHTDKIYKWRFGVVTVKFGIRLIY